MAANVMALTPEGWPSTLKVFRKLHEMCQVHKICFKMKEVLDFDVP